jgi:hypothetical protein
MWCACEKYTPVEVPNGKLSGWALTSVSDVVGAGDACCCPAASLCGK